MRIEANNSENLRQRTETPLLQKFKKDGDKNGIYEFFLNPGKHIIDKNLSFLLQEKQEIDAYFNYDNKLILSSEIEKSTTCKRFIEDNLGSLEKKVGAAKI